MVVSTVAGLDVITDSPFVPALLKLMGNSNDLINASSGTSMPKPTSVGIFDFSLLAHFLLELRSRHLLIYQLPFHSSSTCF